MALFDAHMKHALNRCRPDLVAKLEVDDALDFLQSVLLDSSISTIRAKSTREEKVRELLDCLRRRPASAFWDFLSALFEDRVKQGHMAVLILDKYRAHGGLVIEKIAQKERKYQRQAPLQADGYQLPPASPQQQQQQPQQQQPHQSYFQPQQSGHVMAFSQNLPGNQSNGQLTPPTQQLYRQQQQLGLPRNQINNQPLPLQSQHQFEYNNQQSGNPFGNQQLQGRGNNLMPLPQQFPGAQFTAQSQTSSQQQQSGNPAVQFGNQALPESQFHSNPHQSGNPAEQFGNQTIPKSLFHSVAVMEPFPSNQQQQQRMNAFGTQSSQELPQNLEQLLQLQQQLQQQLDAVTSKLEEVRSQQQLQNSRPQQQHWQEVEQLQEAIRNIQQMMNQLALQDGQQLMLTSPQSLQSPLQISQPSAQLPYTAQPQILIPPPAIPQSETSSSECNTGQHMFRLSEPTSGNEETHTQSALSVGGAPANYMLSDRGELVTTPDHHVTTATERDVALPSTHTNESRNEAQSSEPRTPIQAVSGSGDHGSASTAPSVYRQRRLADPDGVYKIESRPRGVALIINNKTFTQLDDRDGTDSDCENLKTLFQDYLNFQVFVETDLTGENMKTKLKEFVQHLNERTDPVDSCMVAILTHGCDGDVLFGTDGHLEAGTPAAGTFIVERFLRDLFSVTACPEMEGKPKLFILQACRGNVHDTYSGQRTMRCDITPVWDRVRPDKSDVLFFYATVDNYVAYRNMFIPILTDVFRQNAGHKHLLELHAIVNRKMSDRRIQGHRFTLGEGSTTLNQEWFLNPPSPSS